MTVLLEFLKLYSQGKIQEAFRLCYLNPSSTLDALDRESPQWTPFVNFIDALCFSTAEQTLNAAMQCRNHLPFTPSTEFMKVFEWNRFNLVALSLSDSDFAHYWKQPSFHLLPPLIMEALRLERCGRVLSDTELQKGLESLPTPLARAIEKRHQALKSWVFCLEAKKTLFESWNELYKLGSRPSLFRPYFTLNYSGTEPADFEVKEGIPLLFPEAYDWNWEQLLKPLEDKPAIFAFDSSVSLAHCLQFPSLAKSLAQPAHHIYLLNAHPRRQFQLQQSQYPLRGPLVLALPFHGSFQPLFESFQALYAREDIYDHLYSLGLSESYRKTVHRLGQRRHFALREYEREAELHDYYSPTVMGEVALSAGSAHYERLLDTQIPLEPRRVLRPSMPYRLAHIVPQVIDGSHAPSRILRTLIEHCDRQHFQPSVYSTEKLVMRHCHYPVNDTIVSKPTSLRAHKSIAKWSQEGISVWIDEAKHSFEDSAEILCQRLRQDAIDIAVFHGPDPINYLVARASDVPYRFFVEHGVLPESSGFDLLLLSLVEVADEKRAFFASLGSEVIGIPFAVDVTQDWESEPYSKSFLGVPDTACVLTTISNHLSRRLTATVCTAIAQILRRHPEAYYLPMGPLDDAQHIIDIFRQYGVSDRVRPLGVVSCPSQWARSMDLYLNEFPVGSCLGLLDAMAAGCPPVTMYLAKGPAASRYGGLYFGLDRAVCSHDVNDYIEQACRLIGDPTLRAEWSALAQQRYFALSNSVDYVEKVEAHWLHYIHTHPK